MNRRLFLGQTAAGFAVHLIPFSLSAKSIFISPATDKAEAERDRVLRDVAEAIRQGEIGRIKQLRITHMYSPEQTSYSAILALVQRQYDQACHLVGLPPVATIQSRLIHSPSSAFGTHSAKFTANDVVITCEVLARLGGAPREPRATLRVYGTKGILQTGPDGSGYQFVNLAGKIVRSCHG